MNSPQSTPLPLPLPSPPRKAHKGFLREDLLVLRHIFNLDGGRQASTQDRLKTLGLGLNPPDSGMKDLLIVSLDIGSPNISRLLKDGKYQIGLSILDTRHLQSSIRNRTEHNLYDLLQKHQFCTGDQRYFKNGSRGFCFGQSKHIVLEDLNTIIQNLASK
jgi:hypothetical protein